MASLNNGAKFDDIVLWFWKHALPAYHWLSSLLNTLYGNQMPTAKYNCLFVTNVKTEVKANALTLIDEWIIDKVQMECDHGAGSAKARAMKELVKMDKSTLAGLYVNSDFEQLEDKDDLIDYINHVSVDTNCHNQLKAPSRDRKYLVIFKESSTLFLAHETITGKDWTEILDKTPPAQISDPVLTKISTTFKSLSKHGEDKRDLDDMKKLTINVSGLPNDVKEIYLQWQKKEQIIKRDIKIFKNDLTVKDGDDTNTKLELNFILWPKGKLKRQGRIEWVTKMKIGFIKHTFFKLSYGHQYLI